MHWNPGWGPAPGTFVGRLARPVDGRLPVVVTPGFGHRSAIWLAGERVPVEVVATVRAFPGMSADAPLVVTSVAALRNVAGNGSYDPLNGLAYVWARGPALAVEKALKASSLQPQYFVSLEDVLQNPDVAAVKRTLSLLIALGVGVAVLSLVGVALYLYARQRSQAIASALARRMGLTRGAEIRSLWLELVGILVVSGALAAVVGIAAAKPVIGQTDPLPRYRPAPSLVVPWTVVAATFAALLAVALVAAVTTSAAARRANVAEELRLV
jgi:FtsX-like permease family